MTDDLINYLIDIELRRFGPAADAVVRVTDIAGAVADGRGLRPLRRRARAILDPPSPGRAKKSEQAEIDLEHRWWIIGVYELLLPPQREDLADNLRRSRGSKADPALDPWAVLDPWAWSEILVSIRTEIDKASRSVLQICEQSALTGKASLLRVAVVELEVARDAVITLMNAPGLTRENCEEHGARLDQALRASLPSSVRRFDADIVRNRIQREKRRLGFTPARQDPEQRISNESWTYPDKDEERATGTWIRIESLQRKYDEQMERERRNEERTRREREAWEARRAAEAREREEEAEAERLRSVAETARIKKARDSATAERPPSAKDRLREDRDDTVMWPGSLAESRALEPEPVPFDYAELIVEVRAERAREHARQEEESEQEARAREWDARLQRKASPARIQRSD